MGPSSGSSGSSDQTSGSTRVMGAPTVTGQDTAALSNPASRMASQRVGVRIEEASQYQRPVWPAGSKGVL